MRKTNCTFNSIFFLSVLVLSLAIPAHVFGIEEPDNLSGSYYTTSGTAPTSGSCPLWFTIMDRNGSDGGHLKIELDGCQVFGYTLYSRAQGAGSGHIADLEPGDIFIEWDEDPGHGDGTAILFDFTGDYVADPDCSYVQITTNDSRTEWTIYRVLSSGTLTKTGDCCNEHEAIRLERNILGFAKDDGIDPQDCVVPEQEITYTICWDNLNGRLLTDAYIIDWLPEGVTVPVVYTFDPNTWEMSSSHPEYDPETHSHIWPLDDIDPNSWGCVQLTVVVNEKAVPGGILHNVAELYGAFPDPNGLPIYGLLARATQDTNVCCWGDYPDILYVDLNATEGNNNGLDWPNAFLDLQDALDYARSAVCGQVQKIYVAQGTYYPGDNEADSFVLPDGLSVYGGFPTGGSPFEHRNPKRYVTTLSGRIDDTTRNDTLVTMGHETLLDGFTVSEAAEYGIYGNGVDFIVENCTVEKSSQYGIRIVNGNVILKWCNIRDNGLDGVFHQGTGFDLTVENCWMRRNMQHGIYCLNSTPTVRNSIISESDLSEFGNAGIRMFNPAYPPILYNNTFAHNRGAGISFTDNGTINDPNDNDWPDVQNCILWYNNDGCVQFSGIGQEHFRHSCIYDPNDPTGESVSFDLNYNFSTNPRLAYVDPNNVRIRYESPCRDMGNPFLNYDNQLDMDSNSRVYGMYVDIGAYEIVCGDVANDYDWNADGLVNLHEFAKFSRVWLAHDPNDPALTDPNHVDYFYLTDPNSPGYVTLSSKAAWYPDGHNFNYVTTGTSQYRIDLADLIFFLEDAPWLWKACWVDLEEMQMQQMMPGGGGEELLFIESAFEPVETIHLESPPVQEKSALEQILDLATAIVFLEQLWLDEPDIWQEINADDWQRFMDAVYQSLLELQMESIQIK